MKRISGMKKKGQKVFNVYVSIRLEVDAESDDAVEEMLQNMGYDFESNTEGVVIVGQEITDWEHGEIEE